MQCSSGPATKNIAQETGSLDSNPKSTVPKVYRDFSMTRDLTGKIKRDNSEEARSVR